ncbi:PI-actitoxin-Avd5a [Drosophila simulans]|uniref:GD23791 n=1 Tax=Drosophila simulans TaxID=7240 RepID=B4Q3A2_DROSI|nr:PI-actitoxin-Avd5a [Drosophila simulans]EDX04733.1 GD23791 [Drosophila simulans]
MRCLAFIAFCLSALLALAVGQVFQYDCPCPRNYDPVCGSDSLTYTNPCVLDCLSKNGRFITMVKKGRC